MTWALRKIRRHEQYAVLVAGETVAIVTHDADGWSWDDTDDRVGSRFLAAELAIVAHNHR
jgi:hypothetical protein